MTAAYREAPAPTTHPFDRAVRLDAIDTDVRRGRTHPEWANNVYF